VSIINIESVIAAVSVLNIHGKHDSQNMKNKSDAMFFEDIFRGSEHTFHYFVLTKS